MKFLTRNIPVKYLYMLSAMVALLVTLGLYTTYAMFTANVSSGNVVNMDTTLYYDFDISGTQSFHLTKNSIASFYATVNNTSQGAIYYEVYYTSNNDLSNVIIAEVVDDKTTTPTAINTSGNIDTNTSKDIPLVIANNSDSDIDIVIGVVSGYVGNAIVYGSDGYPSGTKITATYNKNDITNSCEAGTNVDDNCYEEVENGYLVTYCPVTSVQLPYIDSSNANAPVLADGMIPVMHNGTTWVKADYYDATSQYAGYDYANKKWANAVMVSSATRNTYMTADVGTSVQEADILAYFVWIPRYKYQLFNASYEAVDSQLINVQFESGTASTGNVTCSVSEIGVETCTNKANGNWYTHPAFTFGDDELEGIWIGKFDTTYGTNTTDVYPSNTVYETPTIKPNVTSLRNQQVSKQFQTAQYFGTSAYLTSTGVNEVDAHMMKNIEWGAVAYLKQSTYGLGTTDIAINSYYSFLTGCGPQSAGSTSYGSTCNAYHTTLGMSASTTGNITGVYDMSGGTWEYTMGVIQDNTTTGRSPMSGYTTSYNSGYMGKLYSKSTGYTDSGNTLAFPAAKYYDLYANGTTYNDQTAYNRSHLGDATGETRSWYSDYASFPYAYYPWFKRGGYYIDGSVAGVFDFNSGGGNANASGGFRVALSTTGA